MEEDFPGAKFEEEVDGFGIGLGVLADVGLEDMGPKGGHGRYGNFAATILRVE